MKFLILSLTLIFSALTFAASTGTAEKKLQNQCPVMEAPINKKLYVDHKGKRVYFCCSSCVSDFKKDPEKYIKKMEGQGITLEDSPKK